MNEAIELIRGRLAGPIEHSRADHQRTIEDCRALLTAYDGRSNDALSMQLQRDQALRDLDSMRRTRLRAEVEDLKCANTDQHDAAADEISRLRAENERLAGRAELLAIEVEKQQIELAALRRPLVQSAEVQEIRAQHIGDQLLREKFGALFYFRDIADKAHWDRGVLLSALETARRELQQLRRLDSEAATHVESVIAMRTHFTGVPPYVGWRGLGLALTETLDRLQSPPEEHTEIAERQHAYRNQLTAIDCLSSVSAESAVRDLGTLLEDAARYRNALHVANTTIKDLRGQIDIAESSLMAANASVESYKRVAVQQGERIERLEGALQLARKYAGCSRECSGSEYRNGQRMSCGCGFAQALPEIIAAATNSEVVTTETGRRSYVPIAAADGQQTHGRTPEQYAIEHGRYLANAAREFMDSCNAVWAAQQAVDEDETDTQNEADGLANRLDETKESQSEYWRGLENAIYEFTKRADRAHPMPQSVSTGDGVAGD